MTLLNEQSWHLLGWTMLHFLWLGAALLIVSAILRRALRRAGPNVRYAHSLVTLLALAALPLATAIWLDPLPPPATASSSAGGFPPPSPPGEGEGTISTGATSAVRGSPDPALATTEGLPTTPPQIIELNPNYNPAAQPKTPPPPSAGEGATRATSHAEAQTPTLTLPLGGREPNLPPPEGEGRGGGGRAFSAVRGSLDPALTLTAGLPALRATFERIVLYLPYLWLLGTPLTFALLATGLLGAERMRRHGTPLTDGTVRETCERLRQALRITRRVSLAVCDRVAQPVLVGIVRPLILLPPVALTGWSPAELEMVLLHELAHVRRWDNLVNLAQRVIESLLFFHPAVWIASTWVRRDREECCDAVVVTRTQEPKQYAELLVSLATPQPLVGLALARHPLAARLRRILKLEDEPMLVSRNTIALLVVIFAVAAGIGYPALSAMGEAQAEATAAAPSDEGQRTGESPADLPPTDADPAKQPLGSPPPGGEGLGEGDNLDAAPTATDPDPFTKALANITYPSPREREIAMRAIKALGLALAPASQHELAVAMRRGYRGGLIVDGVPPGTPFGTVLTKIESTEILSLDDVDTALNQIAANKPTSVTVEVVTADGEVSTPKLGNMATTEPWSALGSSSDITTAEYVLPSDQAHLRKFLGDASNRPLLGIIDIVGNKLTVTGTQAQHEKLKEMLPGIVKDLSAIRDPDAFTELVQPSSQDDISHPLAGIAYPSPREGKIAMRAWKELGIKVAPATDAELEATRKHGKRGGLKLVDFDPFPPMEDSVILTEIQSLALSRGIVEFGDLEKVLDAIAKDPPKSIILKGTIGNLTFGHALALPSSAAEATAKLPFLSLEDQQIADRAYRLLGIELESLTPEEQSRVAELGFQGGLRVSFAEAERLDQRRIQWLNVAPNDLLVGLHVWPITDFQSLDKVLKRPDLAQLSPMKFYVVRAIVPTATGGFADPAPAKDTIITGRIAIDADQLRLMQNSPLQPALALPADPEPRTYLQPALPSNRGTTFLPPEDPTPAAIPTVPAPPSATGTAPQPAQPPSAANPYGPATQLGPRVERPADPAPSPVIIAPQPVPALPSAEPTFKDPEPPKVRSSAALPWTQPTEAPQPAPAVALRERRGGSTLTKTSDGQPLSRPPIPAAAPPPPKPASFPVIESQPAFAPAPDWPSTPKLAVNPPLFPQAEPSVLTPAPSQPQPRPVLPPSQSPIAAAPYTSDISGPPVYRYDGKTFEQWRDLWKHELSTAKRIEAVKALAAFARAGKAKEAAEAILDVAAEYDFQTMDSDLRDAVVTGIAQQIPFTDWQPLLTARYDADPAKWESLATNVFWRAKPASEEHRKLKQVLLLEIAKHGTQAKRLAFQSLMHADPGVNDAEIKQLALDGLQSDDPHFYSSAMAAFDQARTYPPEFVDILLHDASGKQLSARSWLRNSDEKTRPLAEKLLEIVSDPEQATDHLAAIRALGVIGEVASAALPRLVQIIKDSDDPELRVAAAVALDQIEPQKGQGRAMLLDGVVGDEQAELIERMNEEHRAIHDVP